MMGCPLSTDPEPKQQGSTVPAVLRVGQRVVERVWPTGPTRCSPPPPDPMISKLGDWVPLTIQSIRRSSGHPRHPGRNNRDGGIDTPTCLADGGSATTCATRRTMALLTSDPAREIAEPGRCSIRSTSSDGCERPRQYPDLICPAMRRQHHRVQDRHHPQCHLRAGV